MGETWKGFASETSLHGIRYVGATSGFRRLFWIICLLTSLIGYVLLLNSCISNYLSLPINTIIASETEDGIEFPDVTICNLNSIVKSKADIGYDDPRFEKLKLDLPVCDVIRNISGNLTCGQALMCVHERLGIYVIRHCDAAMKNKLRQVLNTSSRIFNPEDFLYHYGHDLPAMLLPYCVFGSSFDQQSTCDVEDFDPAMTDKGLCYTFNVTKFNNRTGGKMTTLRVAGAENGLSVILNVHLGNTLFSDWSLGFRIIVGQRGIGVNRDKGINIAPGSHALVALTAKKFERLPAPFITNCSSERHIPGFQTYSQNACLSNCLVNRTIEKCGCRPVAVAGYPGVPVCSIIDEECVNSDVELGLVQSCSCNPPCKEIQYEPRISLAQFPNKMVGDLLRSLAGINTTDEHIRDNFVFLQVGFSEMEYKINKVQAAYEVSSLIGDIGGYMGLLLGCSLITLIEFFEFLIRFIYEKFFSKNNYIEKQSTSVMTAGQANDSPPRPESKIVNNQWTALEGLGYVNQEIT